MEHQPQVYDMRFPRLAKQHPCPLPGCPGSSRIWNGLRFHFSIQNWGDSIRILEEHLNPLPKCERCGSQVPAGSLNTRHYATENCKQEEEVQCRRDTLQCCFEASRVLFLINAKALPPSEAFTYLGRTITYNNSNWLAVYSNLRKSWRWREW